jgi:glycosyltransferase involved in cell wall biosynthesis
MASKALIAAHNNDFNKGVLDENAYYFSTAEEVKKILNTIKKSDNLQFVENNYAAIASTFNWKKINEQYLQLFKQCLEGTSRRK